nr:spermatogenesis-associated protein 1 isoform X3 [Pelodiscus sinensis]|eukprot:XP_025038971.1 spermatogenesis-associated protein 1 isoform X3 [Pelodiscus sinensis]
MKANGILSCVDRNIANDSRSREVIIPLYVAFVRPCLKYYIQFWGPFYRDHVDNLESIQTRTTKIIRGLEHMTYEERLREEGLFSLQKKKVRGGLVAALKYRKEDSEEDGSWLISMITDQIESNGSLHIPSSLHSEKWESGKNPTSLESSQKYHLSQDQEESNTLRWSQKDKGTVSRNHEKEIVEQAENETQENRIPPGRKGANMENRDNLNAIRMGRNTTRDSGIPESLEDGDMDYLHNKKSPQQHQIRASLTDTDVKQDVKTDQNNVNHLEYSSQYISPPAPPLLALSVNRIQVPIFQTETSKMAEQLKQMKAERRHMERTREELVKKVRGLLEQNKLRRYQAVLRLSCIARDAWKKKYFETKKATASLEDILNKLRQDLELYYQQLLLKLEARDVRKRPNNLTHIANTKNTTIIQVTTVQHEIDQLKQKLDNTKMKLIIEIKMRKQATSDLRALRAELAQKKIQSSLILQSETPTF